MDPSLDLTESSIASSQWALAWVSQPPARTAVGPESVLSWCIKSPATVFLPAFALGKRARGASAPATNHFPIPWVT
jgi:hypothetical protein